MDGFTPDAPPRAAEKVPFFQDARAEDGWRGQGTGKSLETLKAEVIREIGRLGGTVSGFIAGSWGEASAKRQGFRILFTMQDDTGLFHDGQLDIAALPVRYSSRGNPENRRKAALKMALYMVRDAFAGMWFLRQLSPGFEPMLPWMLVAEGKTMSDLFRQAANIPLLLAPGGDFVEGEVVE